MKLAHTSAPVEVSGGSQSSSFSIAMNGKAFRVLSDTLYQNKIGSIVREVSCNAKDAHVAAGTPEKPFEIHLPNDFEPWFSVKDYGVGLSPEDMVNVFTVYFQSTKDNSNDAVGAFGLGAKTPFSYTDQFTVTSVKDGMRRIYSAFITESGVPSVREMDASPTTDHNGVEIKLSVKREDYSKFIDEVSSQLRFFKVKPIIHNNRNFAFKSVSENLVIDSANVAISSDSAGYGQSWAHIIQGDVGYPLDIKQVREKMSADNQRLLSTLEGSQVRFYFNIGEIGVTASREGVEYNPHTIASINAKLDVVRVELTKFIMDNMKSLKTVWDKAAFLNSTPAIGRLAKGANIDLPGVTKTYNGTYVFDISKVMLDGKKKDVMGRPTVLGQIKCWKRGKAVRDSHSGTIAACTKLNFKIVLRDTANKPNIRAKHYLSKTAGIDELIEIDLYGDGGYTDAFIASIKEALGGYDAVIRLSEIEPPAREVVESDGKRVRASYSRPTHYAHVQGASGNIRDWTREFDALDENDEDTVYVEIMDMAIVDGADSGAIAKYELLAQIQDNVLPVIGIRSGDMKKIDGMDNYVKLSEYVDKCITRIKADKSLYVKWRHYLIGREIANTVNAHLREQEVLEALKANAANSTPTKLIGLANRLAVVDNVKLQKMNRTARLMGWDESKVITPSVRKRISECYKAITSKYPLLHLYGDWHTRKVVTPEHLARYVSVM